MTNLQFISLLSTAIGSLVLVILAWLHQNQRLTDLREDTKRQFDLQRTDTVRQFGDVQRQFGDVQRQFGEVQRQFSELRTDTARQFAEVKSTLATLTADYQRFYGMEQRLEGRVDELSKRAQ